MDTTVFADAPRVLISEAGIASEDSVDSEAIEVDGRRGFVDG